MSAMTNGMGGGGATPVQRDSGASGLAETISVILDKGLVLDAYLRVSLVGIEILTVDARVVLASVDTYLRFAEKADRVQLGSARDSQGLSDLTSGTTESVASGKTKGVIEGVKDKMGLPADGGEESRQKSRERAGREK